MTDTFSGVQDLLSCLLHIDPALQRLRQGRDKVRLATQDSHDALFDTAPDQPLPSLTRHAVAFYVAVLNQQHALVEHYRRQLLLDGASPRWLLPVEADDLTAIDDRQLQGILTYVRILTLAPEQSDHAALQRLQALGLGPEAVVSLAQLVAFLAFEARLFGGLQAIIEGGSRP